MSETLCIQSFTHQVRFVLIVNSHTLDAAMVVRPLDLESDITVVNNVLSHTLERWHNRDVRVVAKLMCIIFE